MAKSRRTRGSISSWNGGIKMGPVRWSSSERPLSVRTIWVNGVRHAILSLDDPLLRYPLFPRPGSSRASSETSSSLSNESDTCLVNLHVTYDSSEKIHLPPIDVAQTASGEPSPCPSPTLPGFSPNPLSERVLQWLDLANKGQSLTTPLLPKRLRDISSCVKSAQAKRKLYSRSASIDISNSNTAQRKKSIPVATALVPTADTEELLPEPVTDVPEPIKRVQIQTTPVIVPQRYEPLRPLSAWPTASKTNRPQLHIFIPSLHNLKTSIDYSDEFGSSCISD